MRRTELVSYLDRYLHIDTIADYGLQGLQVEGNSEVSRIAFTVDAGMPCIEAAIKVGAQMQLVHHGLFWGREQAIRGPFGRRVSRLLQADLNLYAAHLALDGHPEVGNNAELARLLELSVERWFANAKGSDIGVVAVAPEGMTVDGLALILKARLNAEPRVLAHGPNTVRRVAIVSGGGAGYAAEAAALGADTLVTGETSHSHFYAAAENNLNVVYGGHYATETVGLKALGRHLNGKFGLETVFIDLPTGM